MIENENQNDLPYISDDDIEQWFDSEEIETSTDTTSEEALSKKYADTQLRVVRSTLDFTLHTLKSSLEDKNYINLSPGYQRRGRWDKKKRSLLIESFLLNVPIPPLFLFENDYNQYEVMDGRQRLEAISEYLDNGFALTGLEFWPELQGKRFRDLPGTIQRGLLRRTIGAVVLLAETSRSDEQFDIRMVLFRRLNTGGVKLNPQELRNALYTGCFNKMLNDLSRHDQFTALWKIPKKTPNEDENTPLILQNNVLYKSMMDCELVLRFFAIREAMAGKVRGSLRHIFDKTMENYRSVSNEDAEHMKNFFISTLNRIVTALGENFLILPTTSQPSRPLYDAIMVATSDLQELDLMANADEIRTRLSIALAAPDQYDILVGRGNTLDSIKDRVNLAKKILLG